MITVLIDQKYLAAKHLLILYLVFLTIFFFITKASAGNKHHILNKHPNYNIIMIWVDALRADHLSCYGYERRTSSNIDKLAAQSVLFENNFTPHTVTIASFMSIITSLYPSSHGVLYVAKDRLSPEIKTLPQILDIYGYTATWIGPEANPYLNPKEPDPHLDPGIGYGRGFKEVIIYPRSIDIGKKHLFNEIEKNKENLFYINFHTYTVHDPYMPSEKYKKSFTEKKYDAIIETTEILERKTVQEFNNAIQEFKKAERERSGFSWEILGQELANEIEAEELLNHKFPESRDQLIAFLQKKKKHYKWDNILSWLYQSRIDCNKAKLTKHLIDLYDATILEFDTEIMGPLIRQLKDLKLYDNTIIIVCADHGDEFCEHGELGHGTNLYEGVIHVPLIMRIPGLSEGSRFSVLTQTTDIFPTILDLLEIPKPHYFQGVSLKPLIYSGTNEPVREFVYGDLAQHVPQAILMIRSPEWKFIKYWDGRKELFKILEDPLEQINLHKSNPKVADELEKELKKWILSLPDYRVDPSFLPHIDEVTKEKIKKTGYW